MGTCTHACLFLRLCGLLPIFVSGAECFPSLSSQWTMLWTLSYFLLWECCACNPINPLICEVNHSDPIYMYHYARNSHQGDYIMCTATCVFDPGETCKCYSSGIVCWYIYNDRFSSFPLIWIPNKNNIHLTHNYGENSKSSCVWMTKYLTETCGNQQWFIGLQCVMGPSYIVKSLVAEGWQKEISEHYY